MKQNKTLGPVLLDARFQPDYFTLNDAAALLSCRSSHLLHLGATNRVTLMAPVNAYGLYKWPIGIFGIGFPEISNEQVRCFDLTDKVIVLIRDLQIIEAKGWTVLSGFYAPSAAQEIIQREHSVLSDEEIKTELAVLLPNSSGSEIDLLNLPDDIKMLRDSGVKSEWWPVEPEALSERTYIEHLLISRSEAARLLSQAAGFPPVSSDAGCQLKQPISEHGNKARFQNIRELIITEAMDILKKYPERCKTPTGKISYTNWAVQIEAQAKAYWTNDNKPVMGLSGVKRLLSENFTKEGQRKPAAEVKNR